MAEQENDMAEGIPPLEDEIEETASTMEDASGLESESASENGLQEAEAEADGGSMVTDTDNEILVEEPELIDVDQDESVAEVEDQVEDETQTQAEDELPEVAEPSEEAGVAEVPLEADEEATGDPGSEAELAEEGIAPSIDEDDLVEEIVEPADEAEVEAEEAVEPVDEAEVEAEEAVEPVDEAEVEAEEVVEPVDEAEVEAEEVVEPVDEAAVEAEEVVEPADEAEGEPDDGRLWYVVHCYSGYENKVRHNLEQRIDSMGMKSKIFDVVVPTEEEIEVKDGKRRTVERRVFPGYILVQMILTEESWYVVRNTPGVTGFVGQGNEPIPLRPEEVTSIVKRMEAEAPRIKVTYSLGQKVRIIDGPFNDFIGTVDDIDMEKAKVRVMVSFFGRETPVELDFLQVEKA